jgi:hypothetical protein
MICLQPGAFFAEALLMLPINPPPVLTLRATSLDSRECEVHCQLVVDDAGHLRMQSF